MAITGKNGYYEQHTAAADGAASTHVVKIQKIIWYGFTDSAHTLQVKTGNGIIILPAIACGTGTILNILQFDFPCPICSVGIETDVLGSGTVIYIYA